MHPIHLTHLCTNSYQCNLYLKKRGNKPDKLALVTCNVWEYFFHKGGELPKNITSAIASQLLKPPFLAVPVNINENHWLLVIFAYSSDLITAPTDGPRTAIIVLDLMQTPLEELKEPLQAFLMLLILMKLDVVECLGLEDKVTAVPIHIPKVIPNYLLHVDPGAHCYLRRFLNNLTVMTVVYTLCSSSTPSYPTRIISSVFVR